MFEPGPRNRRRLAEFLACLALVLVGGCGESDDAIFVVLNFEQAEVPSKVDSICLGLWDLDPSGGQFGQRFALESSEDATLAVDPGSALSGRMVLHGLSFGQRVALHQQDFDFESSEVEASLLACGPGSSATPLERDEVAVAADSSMAVSQGLEGAWIVVAAPGQSQVFAVGSAGLVRQSVSIPTAAAVRSLVSVDVDGDCDDDIIVLSSSGAELWRRERGAFVSANDLLPSQPVEAVQGISLDYNRDAVGDVALVGADGLTLWQGSAQGLTEVSGGVMSAQLSSATAIAAGDLDGDGFVDLAIARSGVPDRLLYGDGGGTFVVDSASLAEDDRDSSSIAIADIDEDGMAEVIVASQAAPVTAFARDEPRRYVDRSFLVLPDANPINAVDMAVVDWNGDCEADILIAADDASVSWASGEGLVKEPALPGAKEVIIDDLLGQGDRDALLLTDTVLRWWRR